MHTINAHFERLGDVSVPDLLGVIGVYVLWRGRAIARPTYIGEGNILSRLVTHHGIRPTTFDGFVACLSHAEITARRAKADAEIVEAMLLWVADRTDRSPSDNRAPGKLRSLDEIFRKHGTVHINVSGMDPLRPPEEHPSIRGRKVITLRAVRDGNPNVEDEWRVRKRKF
ncbi:MAG: hypothetical protein JSS86_00015 [Cyanobacteria bacterium SZAS LIN-2]|nr:hypothetical protein [Cyanobacteria bacterium SZAS LIN-2]